MDKLLKMLKLLDLLESMGLLEYQVEALHNIIMDMIDLNDKNVKK